MLRHFAFAVNAQGFVFIVDKTEDFHAFVGGVGYPVFFHTVLCVGQADTQLLFNDNCKNSKIY